PWVVDPVSLPSRGVPLGDGRLTEALATELLPHVTLVTPNAREAEALAGFAVETIADARQAAEQIAALGCRSVLVTGGHFSGEAQGTDLLWDAGDTYELPPSHVLPGEFHGTGCALSAAIATRLARGEPLPDAVKRSKAWLESALKTAFAVGAGAKPVNHFAPAEPDA
ncbi:MAG: PfkB family carbohydrate kinase, partial [Myxococcota bacterium]